MRTHAARACARACGREDFNGPAKICYQLEQPAGRRLKRLNGARDICIDSRPPRWLSTLFDGARAIASGQRLPVIHYHNAYDCSTLFFSILRIEGYFRVYSMCNQGREISFLKLTLVFVGAMASALQWLHIAAEKARNKTRKHLIADYLTTLFSSRYTCRLPARAHASAAPVVIVLRKRSTASRREGVGNFDPWAR